MKEHSTEVMRIFLKEYPDFAGLPLDHKLRSLYARIMVYLENINNET